MNWEALVNFSIPDWLREEMVSQGKNPKRTFNDVDAARPKTAELLANDDVTKHLEKTNPHMAERSRRGDLSIDEIKSVQKQMKLRTDPEGLHS